MVGGLVGCAAGGWVDGLGALAAYVAGRSPGEAWGEPGLPSGVIVFPVTVAWAVVLGVAVVVGARVLTPSLSGFEQRRRLGADPEARFARPRELAALRFRRPVPGRFILGRVGGVTLASVNPRHRNSGLRCGDRLRRWWFARTRAEAFGAVAIIGLSQSGKSQHALTALRVLSAAGCPMIASSVKGDIVDQLLAQRRLAGRVGIFDPTGKLRDTYETRRGLGLGVPEGWDRRLCVGWSPLDGVATYDDAAAAAHRLAEAGPGMDKVSSGDFWRDQAEMLIAPLVWIAARSGGDMGDVTMWVVSEARPDPDNDDAPPPEPVRLLEPLVHDLDPVTRRDARKAEQVLYGLWNKAPATMGSVYATANTILKPWATEEGRLSSTGQLVNLAWLLGGGGHNTLFISAPPQEQRELRPVLSGAVSSILDEVFRHVDVYGPIDPPLVVFLDEIGNAPLPRLPEYLSTLASSGVLIVTVWQDVAQIKAAYGENYGSILSNSRHVLVFGASKDPATLEWVKQVLGDEGAGTLSRTSNAGELFGGSVSASEQRVALTPSNVLREMPKDRALLISANNLPAEVHHIAEHTVTAFAPLRRWPHLPDSEVGLPTPVDTVTAGGGPSSALGVWEPVDPVVVLAATFDTPLARAVAGLRNLLPGPTPRPRRRRPTGGAGTGGGRPLGPVTLRPPGPPREPAGVDVPRAREGDGAGAGLGAEPGVGLDGVTERYRVELLGTGWVHATPSPAPGVGRVLGEWGSGALAGVDSDGVEDLAGW
ncbi:MAG: type IV secretory system conjugative DNA transfer family protein [Acidimicrobiales bacterium]